MQPWRVFEIREGTAGERRREPTEDEEMQEERRDFERCWQSEWTRIDFCRDNSEKGWKGWGGGGAVQKRRRLRADRRVGWGVLVDKRDWVVHAEWSNENGQRQRRTLLQMSPVALESEADIFVLPALPSPPLHRRGKKKKRQNPPPLSPWLQRGEREGGAQPKCFTADAAALPQQPFPIQNWCPYCSTGVHTPAYCYSTVFIWFHASFPLLAPPPRFLSPPFLSSPPVSFPSLFSPPVDIPLLCEVLFLHTPLMSLPV